jgi:CMP-N-acetylneuraminic acid synthetase
VFFDRIIVSTESKEVATAAGFVEWHNRPDSLALPKSSVWDAVKHYMATATETDYIMLLHPTSPCLRPETVADAMKTMIDMEGAVDAMVSVSKSNPFSWSSAEPNPKFHTAIGTQFMVPRFELNNAIYIAKWGRLFEAKNGYELKWTPYMIPADEAVDIDNITDFNIAEAILQWRQANEGKEPATGNI